LLNLNGTFEQISIRVANLRINRIAWREFVRLPDLASPKIAPKFYFRPRPFYARLMPIQVLKPWESVLVYHSNCTSIAERLAFGIAVSVQVEKLDANRPQILGPKGSKLATQFLRIPGREPT
jgi:hypothetical protein